MAGPAPTPEGGRGNHPMRVAAHALLLAGLVVLSWQSIAYGVAVSGRRDASAQAVRFAPNNALALTARARDQITTDPRAAGVMAQRALRRDPTNAAAAGLLAVARTQEGSAASATALLRYSQLMSRRDLPTQLFAIELAVGRGDIRSALHHYDVALRVGRTMPSLLFPVLAAASADPAIRRPLVRLLASGAPWKDSFLDYMSAHTTDVVAAADLLQGLRSAGAVVPVGPLSIVVQRLTEADQVGRAWSLYAHVRPAADGTVVRNGRFTRVVEQPTVFDWQMIDTGDSRAEIFAADTGGELHMEARSGTGGTVARQRLVLAHGDWILAFGAQPDEGSTLGGSTLDLLCVPGMNRIGRVGLAVRSGSSRQQLRVSVPRACTSQSLEVVLDPDGADAPLAGTLRNVTLARAPAGTALQ